ncbi:MAG TPA: exodeoxyribonuclease V subunit alpha [Nocardioidaceae bacterium]
MTTEAVERSEPVLRARGLLAEFNRAGVLGYADVHVAQRLGDLAGESDASVLLAAALTVRAVRQGSVCLPLAGVATSTAVDGLSSAEIQALPWPSGAEWAAALSRSPLVADGPVGPVDRPLRYVDGLVYLDRYWRQERVVAEYVDRAVRTAPEVVDPGELGPALERLFPGPAPDLQRLAAVVSAHKRFSIVAGGPGTGKTTTVARLLALLQDVSGGALRIALAAPTGKAAARLTEAVADATSKMPAEDSERLGVLTARTLHRLLGSKRGARTRFWHDRDNRLPYDVVVVDEASMVPLTMMSRLVEALRPSCRLVLVGDPDQLASVEAGAVLGDLVERDVPVGAVAAEEVASLVPDDVAALSEEQRDAALRGGVVRLRTVHRFSEEIQDLAEAIRSGQPGRLEDVLAKGHACIELVDADPAAGGFVCEPLRADVLSAGRDLVADARAGDAEGALDALERHRVLCGHREGPHGVSWWARQVEEWLTGDIDGYAKDGLWYVGRPLLVTSNDYQLGLFNGDTGVVVAWHGEPRAAFRREGRVDLLGPSRLSDVQTVHAMSVHRSQGSQFDRVTLILPPEGSPLLTQELVYTAVTRAKEHVRIVGTRAALMTAIQRPVQRASGLRG